MKTLMHGASIIAMTASERAAGRYMRADDHSASTPAPTPAPPPPPSDERDSYDSGEINDAPPEPEGEAAEEPVSGTDDPPAPVKEDGAADDGTGGDPKAEGEGDEPKPEPKKSSAQERIDELTAARREAEREAAYWRGVAEGRNSQEPDAPEEPAAQPELTEPDPANYEYAETDAKYIADLARYETLSTLRAQEQERQINARMEVVENGWKERAAAATAVHEDFNEKVVKGADEGKWACSQIMSIGIKTSPAGAEIAYHLASDPAESDRIARLTPLEQAKEIGRLEYRFEAEAKAKAAEQAAEPAPVKVVSEAPTPIPGARGAGGRFQAPADSDDFAAFEARADQVLATKARR